MSPPSHNSSAPKIMVFRPTIEEMKDFPAYISHMESMGAHKAGIAKIIPPKDFVAAYDYEKAESMMIPAPIQQEVMGHQGLYTQYNIQKKPLTFPEFRKLAKSSRYATPQHFDYDDLERKYWKNITYNPPIYAADISGSLYSKGCDIWNINKLNTLLDVIEEEQGVKIEGVNTAYLYFGMWKTTFAWHTEDMDLYSINYLHFGAPKSWYSIPPEHGKRLERLASGFFPQSFQLCSNFLRHKMTLISPQILKKYSIPYDKITQETGEFMITFPYGYHAGYNHGYNCAESTNFASLRWLDFGKRAKCCSCQRDSVKINMDPFIRIFQPHRYDAWKQGKDVVYIEDIDKPTSGIQPPNLMQTQSSGKSQNSRGLLQTRRQPLHKKDGRRVKSGTTNQQKRTNKGTTVGEQSPVVTIPTLKIEVDPTEPDKLFVQAGIMETFSVLTHGGLGEIVVDNKEPAAATPTLEAISVQSQCITSSTSMVKKKKSPLEKGGSKSKKKYACSSQFETGCGSHDSPPNIQCTESRKRKSTSVGESAKPKSGRKSRNETKYALPASEMDSTQFQSNGSNLSDGLLIASENMNEPHYNSHHNMIKGKMKKKSQKTGLLLEKERAKLKKKSQKAAFQKLKNGVSREHAYSSSHGNADTLHRAMTKYKQQQMNNPLEGAESSQSTKEGSGNLSLQMDMTKSLQVEASAEVISSDVDRNTVTCHTDISCSMSTAVANFSRPKGKAKHDFTSQEFAAMKAWARSMNGLWVTQPHSYDMELAYNLSMADQRPGCCVCMLFYNEKIDGGSCERKGAAPSISVDARSNFDYRTQVLTPEMCFAATNECRFPECRNDALTSDGCSVLLTCSQCKIAVHASCYGETLLMSDSWKCRRCQEQDYLAECCLCNLRGGALKPTTNGRWAHIVCAISIPEVTFENVCAREPINILNISPARLKLKCFFCRPFIKMASKFGGLIQCSVGRCALAFHVTCAQAAGVIMEPCDWPYAVYATCLRHPYSDKMKDKPRDEELKDVFPGQTVIAKHKNSRYYKSEVVGQHQQAFYHVKFDDSSYSDNLYLDDIESHDCVDNGPPGEGDSVSVRWTDGLLYTGSFVKSYTVKMYDVEFEDGSESRVKREDIYCQDELLPKKVSSKLSTASDMKHENFWESEIIADRHRHVHSLYASIVTNGECKASVNDKAIINSTCTSSSDIQTE